MEKNRQLKIALPTRSDRLPTIFVQHQTELPSGGWLLQRPLTPSSLVGLRQLLGLYEDSGPLVFLTMARLNQKKYTTNGLPLRTYNIYVFFPCKSYWAISHQKDPTTLKPGDSSRDRTWSKKSLEVTSSHWKGHSKKSCKKRKNPIPTSTGDPRISEQTQFQYSLVKLGRDLTRVFGPPKGSKSEGKWDPENFMEI